MTNITNEQKKEYIITEEQLRAIEKWDSRHLGKEYRSRPHPTAPPEQKYIIEEFDVKRIRELIPFSYEADIRELDQILDSLHSVPKPELDKFYLYMAKDGLCALLFDECTKDKSPCGECIKTITEKEIFTARKQLQAQAARAATLAALSLLEEWDYHNNRNFLKPHPTFHDMIRMVREKPDEARKHVESLRDPPHHRRLTNDRKRI